MKKRPYDEAGAAKPMQHDEYCWMNAAYVLGTKLTDAFAKYRLLHRDPRRRGRRQGREPAVPCFHVR